MLFIDIDELDRRFGLDEPPVLLEALPLDNYRAGHLPGALHLPSDQVTVRAAALIPRLDYPVVVYCQSAACNNSRRAATELLDAGYTDVVVYKDGKQGWEAAGRPLSPSYAPPGGHRIAIVVLSDANSGEEGLGRIVNALTAANEYQAFGDDVSLTFTGAGTRWLAKLRDPEHPAHRVFLAVRDRIDGACGFCAAAFDQTEAVEDCGVPLLEEFGASMSFRRLTSAGYQVLTF